MAVRLSVAAALGVVALTGASVAWMRSDTDGYIHGESDVPETPVALVLGAQVFSNGVPSPFLEARLAIAQRLLETGKVRAILQGRFHVTIDDIDALAHPVLRHRIVPTFNAEAEGITVDDIITRVLKAAPRGTAKKLL